MKKRLRRFPARLWWRVILAVKLFADEEAIETDRVCDESIMLIPSVKLFADEEAIETRIPPHADPAAL